VGAFNPPVKQDNPDPRVACALLLDTSYSMRGDRIEHLNAGFTAFCASIAEDPLARKRTDVTVITFGGAVEVAVPFHEGRDLTPTTFAAQGATPLGEALDTGLDLLAARKSEYKEAGLEYFRPWLFVITDGMPTDEQRFARASKRVREAEAAKEITVFTVGAGEADLETLSQLSAVREPLALNGVRFEELFAWLSTSMSVVTQSSAFGPTDATVAATEAAEQVPLPSPAGWATW
jgi:uncharacterized protein YegL